MSARTEEKKQQQPRWCAYNVSNNANNSDDSKKRISRQHKFQSKRTHKPRIRMRMQ